MQVVTVLVAVLATAAAFAPAKTQARLATRAMVSEIFKSWWSSLGHTKLHSTKLLSLEVDHQHCHFILWYLYISSISPAQARTTIIWSVFHSLASVWVAVSHLQVGHEIRFSSEGSCAFRRRLNVLCSSHHVRGWGHWQSNIFSRWHAFLHWWCQLRPWALMTQDSWSLLCSPSSSSSPCIWTGQANRRVTTSSMDTRRDAMVKMFLISSSLQC